MEIILLPWKVFRSSRRGQIMLDAFQNQGNSLAYTDTHGAERVFAFCAQELVERCGYKTSAAGAQRVADGDRATVWIDVRGVVWNSQFAQDRKGLRSEGFIQFDDVHLARPL